MPRPKKEGAGPPKTRSRFGCWPCKHRKIKCGEEKPTCKNCEKQEVVCDYSIRLNWASRNRTRSEEWMTNAQSVPSTPSNIIFPSPEIFSGKQNSDSQDPPRKTAHARSKSSTSSPSQEMKFPAHSNHSAHSNHAALSVDPRQPLMSPSWTTSPVGISHISALASPTFSNYQFESEPSDRSKRRRLQSPNDITIRSYNPLKLNSNESLTFPTILPPIHHNYASSGLESISMIVTDNTQKLGRIEFKSESCKSYGYDKGFVDLDDANDDTSVLVNSPDLTAPPPVGQNQYDPITIDFDDYYAKPVRVDIPDALHPLPSELTSNPMNLLYFHHFLNHTARILVPHDCRANPFRTVLPLMAVHDKDLMSLLLAYSACHRASLVRQNIPSNRITSWLAGVFQSIGAKAQVTQRTEEEHNSLTASSIMLASLDIISSSSVALGTTYSWPSFLKSARQIIQNRPIKGISSRESSQEFFLCRWFAYLDIIGSLSGPHGGPIVDMSRYWVEPNHLIASDTIDCFLGINISGMKLLGDAAKLVKETEPYRLSTKIMSNGTNGANGVYTIYTVNQAWAAPVLLKQRAEELISNLEESVCVAVHLCPHEDPSRSNGSSGIVDYPPDLLELLTTNYLYHWTAIVTLRRRVLAQSPDSNEVRDAVAKVCVGLEGIRSGSPAEACLLFPIFIAGCESRDSLTRQKFRQRINDIEGFGLKQVSRAKELIERVWAENENWENLVTDEFVG